MILKVIIQYVYSIKICTIHIINFFSTNAYALTIVKGSNVKLCNGNVFTSESMMIIQANTNALEAKNELTKPESVP